MPEIGEYACRGCAGLAFTVPLPYFFLPAKRPGRKSRATARRVEAEMRRFAREVRLIAKQRT